VTSWQDRYQTGRGRFNIIYVYVMTYVYTVRVIDLFNWFETFTVTFRDLNIDTTHMYIHTNTDAPPEHVQ